MKTKTTIELTAEDLAEIVKAHIEMKGMKIAGTVDFRVEGRTDGVGAMETHRWVLARAYVPVET